MLNSHKYTTIFLSRNTFLELIPFQLHTLLLMLNLRLTYLGCWSISTNQQDFLSFFHQRNQAENLVEWRYHTPAETYHTLHSAYLPCQFSTGTLAFVTDDRMSNVQEDSYPLNLLLEQGSKKVINDLNLYRFLHLTNSPPFNQENSYWSHYQY